jgi:chorismate mutase/prephenate dehydratase
VTNDPLLDELRDRISAADRTILDAMNKRLDLVERLRTHKQSQGIAFVDPERERELLAALVTSNPGPLTEEGLKELFREILALTKRELER